ncbi:hypothetical protein FB451DRAFT_1236055 [Mycena latifolia]|nr:hypothetical protein FB451DRAFT_1236055 [Mycena latifolia]
MRIASSYSCSSQLAELRTYGLSWAIRSKPEISDPFIMEKWRQEALDQQEGLRLERKLTENMVNYVLTELAGYARLSDPTSGIEVRGKFGY